MKTGPIVTVGMLNKTEEAVRPPSEASREAEIDSKVGDSEVHNPDKHGNVIP